MRHRDDTLHDMRDRAYLTRLSMVALHHESIERLIEVLHGASIAPAVREEEEGMESALAARCLHLVELSSAPHGVFSTRRLDEVERGKARHFYAKRLRAQDLELAQGAPVPYPLHLWQELLSLMEQAGCMDERLDEELVRTSTARRELLRGYDTLCWRVALCTALTRGDVATRLDEAILTLCHQGTVREGYPALKEGMRRGLHERFWRLGFEALSRLDEGRLYPARELSLLLALCGKLALTSSPGLPVNELLNGWERLRDEEEMARHRGRCHRTLVNVLVPRVCRPLELLREVTVERDGELFLQPVPGALDARELYVDAVSSH